MRRIALIIMMSLSGMSHAAAAAPTAQAVNSTVDTVLAKQLGADENGMRRYVLVILKTGPHRVPDGEARVAMFKGHFANMTRLAEEGKLALAGPFGDKNEWRGMFILASLVRIR